MSAKKLPEPLHAGISSIGSQFPHDLQFPTPETAGRAILEEDARLNLFLTKEEPFSGQAQPIRWGINE